MVSTAAFHARVRGSVPGLGGSKETKMFLPHPRVKVSIVGSLRDREVACSASDRQDSNFESRVWRTVSSQSSHHPQEVLLAQLSLYVHKGGLKPDSFHFIFFNFTRTPFGLRNSGQTFQRFIDHITRGLDFVFVYFNNLLVTSVDHKTHKKHLQIMFTSRIRDYNNQPREMSVRHYGIKFFRTPRLPRRHFSLTYFCRCDCKFRQTLKARSIAKISWNGE